MDPESITAQKSWYERKAVNASQHQTLLVLRARYHCTAPTRDNRDKRLVSTPHPCLTVNESQPSNIQDNPIDQVAKVLQ